MKLIIVRHGETEENVKRIIQGQTHGTLSKKGQEQARKVGEHLKNEKIDVIYVSDLKRTIDTAAEIIKHHPDIEVIYEPRIRERNLGIFEGKHFTKLHEHVKNSGIDYFEFKPEKGESIPEANNRIIEFYNEIIEKHSGGTVLIVSHGGTIAALLLHILKKTRKDYKEYHPKNTAITVIEINENGNKIHKLNSTEHL